MAGSELERGEDMAFRRTSVEGGDQVGMLRAPEDSFLGSHINKIDAKGRIAAPADFRRALNLDAFNGFYCLPSLRGPLLECGGGDFIDSLKAMIGQLDPFDPDRWALEEHLLGQVRPIHLDGEGRFILPEQFRGHARLAERALFVGLGETFHIRPVDSASEVNAKADQAKAALMRLRNPVNSIRGGS